MKFQILTAVHKKIRTLPVHTTVSTGTRWPMFWADCCLNHHHYHYTSSYMNKMGIWYTESWHALSQQENGNVQLAWLHVELAVLLARWQRWVFWKTWSSQGVSDIWDVKYTMHATQMWREKGMWLAVKRTLMPMLCSPTRRLPMFFLWVNKRFPLPA